MCLHDVFDDRQPQSGAAEVSGARFIDPIKALGETRQIFFRNSRARVTDGDFDLRSAAVLRRNQCRGKRDFTAQGGVFECVIDEIDEQLLQSVKVAQERG